ncbi:MAG TPA: type I restriction-modification enzyme R subunit C-terminal domain-containing protein, partial [Thiotrichales bacterium]|nr:type I restriction-modification enzyme R subunit C-terminal domain-containing protein [Thiotrichales bacterium]
AIGVTKSLKTASQPLITKPSVSLKDLAMGVMMGARDEDTVASLAGRLARLDKQLDEQDKARIRELAQGTSLTQLVKQLLDAIDPDTIEAQAPSLLNVATNSELTDAQRNQVRDKLVGQASQALNGELIELIDSIRRDKEQTIVHDDLDTLITADWAGNTQENAQALSQSFADYLQQHANDIEALNIYFHIPARRAEVSYSMIKSLLERLKQDRPTLAPLRVWQAYAQLENYQGTQPISDLAALVALIRRVCGLDNSLTPYDATVRKNFQRWIMAHHSGAGDKFNEDQMQWLQMMRDHIAQSFHLERDDLDLSPFDAKGGLGRMYQLFGSQMDRVIDTLNRELVA